MRRRIARMTNYKDNIDKHLRMKDKMERERVEELEGRMANLRATSLKLSVEMMRIQRWLDALRGD